MRSFVRKTMLAIVFSVLVLSGSALFAASSNNNVAILYDGNTETNRETINFIRKEFRSTGVNYTLSFVQDPTQIKAGQYRAVVVLSTGVASGVDTKLASFINGYSAKKEIILISLLAGSQNLTVTSLSAQQSSQGVDAISSASLWGERGGNSANIINMHQTWVAQLAKLLSAR